MTIIKVKCKVCGSEKSKWAMCKNVKTHNKIFNESMEKQFGKKEIFPENFFNGTHNDAAIINP